MSTIALVKSSLRQKHKDLRLRQRRDEKFIEDPFDLTWPPGQSAQRLAWSLCELFTTIDYSLLISITPNCFSKNFIEVLLACISKMPMEGDSRHFVITSHCHATNCLQQSTVRKKMGTGTFTYSTLGMKTPKERIKTQKRKL